MVITPLTIRRRRLGPVIVVTPDGELDVSTADHLRTAVDTALRRTRFVVVDLSAVSFLDCGAVRVLVAAARQADQAGGRLRVAALPGHAHRVFGLLDLYRVLGGHHDVATEFRQCLHVLALSSTAPLGVPA